MKQYADQLKKGEPVSFRPRGNSMIPKIYSGNLVTVSPNLGVILKGDIVFCKIGGKYYVHLVKATQGKRYQIGNNKGHVNGWIGVDSIFGKVIKVEK